MIRAAGLFVSMLVITPCPAWTESPSFEAALDAFLQEREAHDFSGAVVVERGGEVVYARYSGMANRALGVPWSESTVFSIGSITKPMTAAAIVRLHVDGKLSVNESIGRWIPGLPGDKRAITIHHLLTHSAGVPEAFGDDFDPAATREWLLERFRACTLLWGPDDFGRNYQYSNVGYSLLAVIIEAASGLPYEEYLNTALFNPAGMSMTGYTNTNWRPADFAHGYRSGKDIGVVALKHALPDGPSWNLRGNGGICTTTVDLLRWTRAMRELTCYTEEMIRLIETPHVRENDDPRSFYYGYGWEMYTTRRGTKCITHEGGDGTSFAQVLRFVDEDTVILLASNEARASAGRFVDNLLEIVFPPSESDPFR